MRRRSEDGTPWPDRSGIACRRIAIPRKPKVVLPKGAIDTHVHVFEPGYALSPGRGYNPPDSTLADLQHLHATLGVDRVVFTQPSIYGIDNSAILDGMAALNARDAEPGARGGGDHPGHHDDELAALDAAGVRGVRLNTDNKGGMPIEMDDIPRLAARIAPFGWHIEFLFPGKDIVELMPVFAALKVPMSIGHFAYQPATAGIGRRASRRCSSCMRRGNTWMKISGANRVSATDLPPYDDVKPMAQALIEAAPERIMWGTDWPHPNKYVVNPNDGDLVDAFGDWVTDEGDAPQDHGRQPRRLLPVLTPGRRAGRSACRRSDRVQEQGSESPSSPAIQSRPKEGTTTAAMVPSDAESQHFPTAAKATPKSRLIY